MLGGILLAYAALLSLSYWVGQDDRPADSGRLAMYTTPTGKGATFSTAGSVRQDGEFFQALGTNGRNCATCHALDQGMSVSGERIRDLFARTDGNHPLFATVDGANCPTATPGAADGHKLLLENGLFRIELPVPADAEFRISVVHDPYGCAIVTDPATKVRKVSVYRRPLPATNLAFSSVVMWDGRETVAPLDDGKTFGKNLLASLSSQARGATTGHAQADFAPTQQQIDAIVRFELSLFTAQLVDMRAGRLDEDGGNGGPAHLARQKFYPLINDVVGGDPTGATWTDQVMDRFKNWFGTSRGEVERAKARRDIAEGERLFNSAPLNITTVRGLNDVALTKANLGVGAASPGSGCTTCHDAPNVGSMSRPILMDIGVTHSVTKGLVQDRQIRDGLATLTMPDLPVYRITGCPNPFYPGQPVSFETTDPGRALVTGKCIDLNRVKVPMIRGLSGRAPYFHNGSAATLEELVEFYDKRFQMGLTAKKREQLTAFLNSI